MSDVDFRLIGKLSIAYLMTLVAEVLRDASLDVLDLIIVTAVSDANHRPVAKDGATGRGISRNAVSRRLNVPLETVRRRVAGLVARKILIDQSDGLVFSPDNEAGLGGNAELDTLNYRMLRHLFRELKAHGVPLD